MFTKTLEMRGVAPNFIVKTHRGTEFNLHDYYQRQPVALFFGRDAVCFPCRDHVAQLVKAKAEFDALGVQLAVVLNTDVHTARAYATMLKTPFPILADEDHAIYDAYGFTRNFGRTLRVGSVVVSDDGMIDYYKSTSNPWDFSNETHHLLRYLQESNA